MYIQKFSPLFLTFYRYFDKIVVDLCLNIRKLTTTLNSVVIKRFKGAIRNMKAVVYGAGNIGRGFIGALLSQTGYNVTFIDIDKDAVAQLNREKQYPVRIVSNEGYIDEWIKNVSAIDGNDVESVSNAIADCDILATAIGSRVLPIIAPNLVSGIRKRFEQNKPPLDILICENLMDANVVLEGYISNLMSPSEVEKLKKYVGFVETSIGRMVPIQTPEMNDGNRLRICVEKYGFLPVDKAAFKSAIPDNPLLKPFEPFDFYIKRKLFLHNMGHATCAYLGLIKGYTYISEAIADCHIRLIVENAMAESSLALSTKYNTPLKDLTLHSWDLVDRFCNQQLADTCLRVGFDAKRKLGQHDRLVGASLNASENGITPIYICVGLACAIYALLQEQGQEQSLACAVDFLTNEVSVNPVILSNTKKIYELLLKDPSLSQIQKECISIRNSSLSGIV